MSVKYLANSVEICQFLLSLSLVGFGLLNLSNLGGLVKFISVESGLGKFNMFDCSLVKSDVTKKNKKKNMMTC